jgi:hypothetical protein
MSRAHLTALVATLALGAVAPRLAAQDTSSAAGQARPDTSAYTGAGGVDTSARPGRVGATDTTMGDSAASDSTRVGQQAPIKPRSRKARLRPGADTMSAPGRADTGALGPTDSSGMRGRHPDSTKVGDTTSPRSSMALPGDTGAAAQSHDSSRARGWSSDSSEMAQPSTQPGQSTSPSGRSSSDSSRSQ